MNHAILDAWKMSDIPHFRGAPGAVDELMKVFVGREDYRAKVRYTLSTGENVLVRGAVGIGKTAFMMATLNEMAMDGDSLGRQVLAVHIRQFEGGTRNDFYRVILYALARRFSPENKRARSILAAITGVQKRRGRSSSIGASIEVGVPGLFKTTGEGTIGQTGSELLGIDHPEHLVDELLSAIKARKYERAVVAVDDLDRQPNQGGITKMFEDSLDLIRDARIAFIFSGRRLTLEQDALLSASGLDIYNMAISIGPLSIPELCLVAKRTMGLVRSGRVDSEAHPFAEEVLESIATKADGVPRNFVLLCGAILRLAFTHGDEKITKEVFERRFGEYQDEVAGLDVSLKARQALFLGLQDEGLSLSKDANLDEVLNVLGLTTIREFVDFAEDLVRQDLFQRSLDERGETVYRVAPAAEKLAKTGFFETHGGSSRGERKS